MTTAQTVSFAAGDASKTVTVTSLDDNLVENDETFEVRLSAPSRGILADGTGIGTITDATTLVEIGDAEAAEGEDLTFTLTRKGDTSGVSTVRWITGDDTREGTAVAAVATADSDYTAVTTAQTVSFAAGDTSKTVTVTSLADNLVENDETFEVRLSNPTGATLADDTGIGTITDATILVEIGDAEAAEGEDLTFTLTRSGDTSGISTVQWTTDADNRAEANAATAGSDYTAVTTAQTVSFAAGDASKTVTVTSLADNLVESDETFEVRLSSPTGATLADDTGIGTITDATILVQIGDAEAAEGSTLTFTLTRKGDTSGASTVQWITGDDTRDGANLATADSDYTAVTTTQTVSFAAGDASKTVTVDSLADNLVESDETFEVRLSNPTGATLADDTGIGTITDTTTLVEIGDAEAAEGSTLTFTLTRTGDTSGASTVQWITGDDTRDGANLATADSDYTAVTTAQTVSFAAGDASKTVTVDSLDDTLDEPNETFEVRLSSPNGATLADDTGIGTITDDDGAPTLSIGDVTVTEGDTAAFTISLSTAPGRDVTVTATTADGTATAPGDYTHTTQTVTIAAGATSATFNVATTKDSTAEPDETFTVALSAPANATLADNSGTGTITDLPEVTIDSVSVDEGDTATFTVALSRSHSAAVTVTATTANGSAVAGDDYTARSAVTVTIAAGTTSASFTVATTEDTLDEPNETFTVTLAAPTNALIKTATGTGTIVDDDTPSLALNDVTVPEGDTAAFTITLSQAQATDVTVTATTADDTAVAGADYTHNSRTVTIAAGATTASFTVATLEDTLDEPNETFTVGLAQPSTGIRIARSGTGTITDDDNAPTLSIDDVTVAEGASAAFTIALSTASGRDVTVTATTADGTAIAPGDYTHTTQTVTIAAGATSATFNVATTEDTLDEPNETFTVALSAPAHATLDDDTGIGTITDDDGAPTLSIDDVTVTEGDTAAFTISLSTASGRDVTVTATTADGTATAPGDYTHTTQTVTIAAGATSATFNVDTTEDSTAEPDETFTVALSAPANATLHANDHTGTGTIRDDETPALSIDDVTVTEGASAAFTITRSGSTAAASTVRWATAEHTGATHPASTTDYTAVNATTVSFAAGERTKTVEVQTTEDTLDEPDETFQVVLSQPSDGTTIADATGIGTITDDDDAPTLSIDDVTVAEGASAAFTIALSAASGRDVTVTAATADGTAVAPGDYTARSAVTVTIAAGTTSATFNVATTEDTLDEPNETFTVALSAPAHATLDDDTGIGTITDDDNAPTLSIDDVTVAEGASAAFTIALSAASGRDVTVTAATADGTASAPGDYTARSAVTVTIAAGTTSATFNVATTKDSTAEPDETFTVALSAPANATLADNSGTGTITDLPEMTIDSVSVDEGDTATFTVALSRSHSAAVTVTATTADGTASAPGDYTARSAVTVTIAAGTTSASFNVATTEDTFDEPNETFTVTLAAPTNALIKTATGTGTIVDDDTPSLALNDVTVPEGDTAAFTITLSQAQATDVTVTATTADDTAVAGADYTHNSRTVTIAAGATTASFTVATLEDTLDEPNETFTVGLAQPSTGIRIARSGTGTITDDDNAPTLSIGDVTVAEGASAAFNISLSTASGRDVTVTATTADGTAIAPGDYTHTTQTVTIAAGATSATFNVATTEDTLDEPNETFTVALSAPAHATLDDDTGIGTITDDDGAPTLSIDDVTVTEGDTAAFTISLSTASGRDVTVTATTADGTATAPGDYTHTTQTVTIAAGATSATFNVDTTEDSTAEPDETFTVALSAPANATLHASDHTGTGTIRDDETPALSIDDVTVTEGASATFTITRSGSTAAASTVRWATAEHTGATHPASTTDYTAVNATTVSFAAGERTKTVEVQTTEDTLDEPDETFQVVLSQPSDGTTIADATGIGTITDDDDAPTLSIDDVTVAEGASAAFTIALTAASGRDVTVTAATADGTAVAGSDYTARSAVTVTIAAGTTSASFNVDTLEDTLDEPNETFTVALSAPAHATLDDDTGIGTITDDDNAPTLSIGDVTVAEGASAAFTIALSTASGRDVTVTAATADGTAVAPGDYTARSAVTVTIAAGATSATFDVATLEDTLDEPNETFTVALSAPAHATLDDDTGTGTITDDDGAPTLSIGDVTVAEGDTAAFTISLSTASGRDVTVTATTADGTATAPGDYTHTTQTVTIAAGTTSATFNVDTTEDSTAEPDETFTVALSAPANATLHASDHTGTGTIRDDETPALSIDDVTVTEGASAAFTITRSGSTAAASTVRWATAEHTGATHPASTTDYTAVNATTVSFAAGEHTKTVEVQTTGDTLDEPDETFQVVLSQPSDGTTIADATGIGTITDDDDAPTLSIDDVTVAEGASAAFTITLSTASGRDVTVTAATADGTAVAPGDYTARSAVTVTIAAGTTSASFDVATTEDTLDEPNETFEVRLSSPTGGATLADDTGTGTITDDDGAPTLSIGDVTVAEGASAAFNISLSTASGRDVTVTAATADGTAVAPGDYTARSAVTVTIAAGTTSATFTVATLEDTLDEPNETFTVTLSAPANATLDDDTGTGTITDDDGAPTLSIGDVTVAEGASAAFTIALSTASGHDVTVTAATADGTAVAPGDYTARSAVTVTIAAGTTSASFDVATTEDTLDEPNETFEVRLSSPTGGATLADGTGIGTITDDDDAPTPSIDDVTVAEGASATFTISLSTASGRDVTVTATTADGTATAPGDYTHTTQTVTIAAGTASASFTVATTADSTAEPDETFTVALSAPAHATLHASDHTGTGTITDDETPALSIDDVTVTEGDTAAFTISLSTASGRDVTVTATTADGTASAPGDYTHTTQTVTIAAGTTSASFTVATTEDTLDEPNETFEVRLSSPTGGATLADATGIGTITDDDNAPTLSIDDVTVTEGNILSFTLTRKGDTSGASTVRWITGDDTRDGANLATADSDYTAVTTAQTVSFAAGDTSKTVTVDSLEDTLDEPNETFEVRLSSPTGATLADDTGVGTITDDDDAPTLSIDDVTVTEGDTLSFTLTRKGDTSGASTVRWITGDDTRDGANLATADSDYTAVTTAQTVSFAAGDTSKTVTVDSLEDTLDEPNETFEVRLSNPTGATLADDTGVGTITDDDDAPTLSIDDVTVAEGATLSFTLTRTGDTSGASTVQWITGDDTRDGTNLATADSDYTAVTTAQTVTFDAGDASKTVTVDSLDDNLVENDETFDVRLSSPTGATLADDTGIGTITDDDNAPTLSIDDVTVTEGVTAAFTISLSTASGRDVTVTATTADGTASAPGDYTHTTQTVTITAGTTSATFNVDTTEDTLDEPNETFQVRLSSPTGATLADGTGIGTITDDDDAPTLSIDDVTVTEGDAATFTVTLSAAAGRAVTVTATTADGTATAPDDYANRSAAVTLAAGQTEATFAVATAGDTVDEPDETFTVTLSAASGATIAVATGTGTILDDDLPTLSIDDVEVVEGNPAGFRISLSRAQSADVTVTATTVDGTATAPDDYKGHRSTVVIAAGQTEAPFMVATIKDEIHDPDEDFKVMLSEPKLAALAVDEGKAMITEQVVEDRITRINEAILPPVASALMRSWLDRMTSCIDHAVSDAPDTSPAPLLARLAGHMEQRDTGGDRSLREALGGAWLATALPADEEQPGRGDLTFCAGGDWRRMSDDGPIEWDGELFSAHAGGNVRLNKEFVTGLELWWDKGRFDWTDRTGSTPVEGRWQLRLDGLHPYAMWLSPEGKRLWAMAVFGSGELDVDGHHPLVRSSDGAETGELRYIEQSADVTQTGVALGGELPLATNTETEGVSFALRGDLWLGRFDIEGNGDLLKDLSVDTRGIRGFLERSRQRDLENGASLASSMRIGAQYDDAAGGAGVEVGTDVAWRHPSGNLTASLRARVLTAGNGLTEWGVGGDVRLASANGLGPQFSVSTSQGDTADGTDAMWKGGSEATARGADDARGLSLDTEMGWGTRARGGLWKVTPFTGLSLSSEDARTLRTGVRLGFGEALSLGLEGQRHQGAGNVPVDRRLLLRLEFRW